MLNNGLSCFSSLPKPTCPQPWLVDHWCSLYNQTNLDYFHSSCSRLMPPLVLKNANFSNDNRMSETLLQAILPTLFQLTTFSSPPYGDDPKNKKPLLGRSDTLATLCLSYFTFLLNQSLFKIPSFFLQIFSELLKT